MEFGMRIPNAGALATPDNITAVAKKAEELGYDAIWATDHVVVPVKRSSRFPYSPTGQWMWDPQSPYMDPFIALACAAAATSKVKLGTSILLLPLRHPILVAKSVAALDLVSRGRIALGVGVGWLVEEYEIMGVPFAERHDRTAESVRMLKALWTQDFPEFEGKYYRCSNMGFTPKPAQKPHPPIEVGGAARFAMKLAATDGDRWHPAWLTLAEFKEKLSRFRAMTKESGRKVPVTFRPLGKEPVTVEYLLQLRDLNVSHVHLDTAFRHTELPPYLEEMEQLAEVMAKARAAMGS